MEKKLSIKNQCHKMLNEMFKRRSAQHIWLLKNVGYEVHFSDINKIQELERIHQIIQERYIRKGFPKHHKPVVDKGMTTQIDNSNVVDN